ncbi:MAG: hypothetical protein NC483_07120 [Ruminococcus sp.]|nr:hypothetical protein [Ruminococcus sp.]
MLHISEEQKRMIVKNNHDWVNINGKNYYVKKHRVGIPFSEIIAKRIMDVLNIKNANYEAVIIDDELFYLSEDLNGYGTFVGSEILKVKIASLYDYWTFLEKLYKDSAKELMAELIRVYLFDLVMMHADRNYANWGILTNQDGIHICTLDNELILASNSSSNITSYLVEEREIPYSKYKSKIYKPFYKSEKSLKEFENFLKSSSEEYVTYAERVLNLINPDLLNEIILSIENEYSTPIKDKEKWLMRFTENYEVLKEIIKRTKGLTF